MHVTGDQRSSNTLHWHHESDRIAFRRKPSNIFIGYSYTMLFLAYVKWCWQSRWKGRIKISAKKNWYHAGVVYMLWCFASWHNWYYPALSLFCRWYHLLKIIHSIKWGCTVTMCTTLNCSMVVWVLGVKAGGAEATERLLITCQTPSGKQSTVKCSSQDDASVNKN